jgi:hypothetical protein
MEGKCCCTKRKKLCPLSFGVALGITAGLAYFIWVLWVIYNGPTPMMAEYHIPMPTMQDGIIHALWILLKGFVFGFFLALFYDLISCCCKMRCCGSKGNCSCCNSSNRPEAGKTL